MEKKHQHYSTKSPEAKLRLFTISESLKRHLYIFKTSTGIFSYRKVDLGTKVLIENMVIPKEPSDLLDIGCGYGVIGIVLGNESLESNIFFIEKNKRAVWCTKQNVKINLPDNKARIKIIEGNYFEPIKKKNLRFDGIYMNPPLREGREEFLTLCKEVKNYLKPNGFFEFVVKRKMGASYLLDFYKNTFPEDKIQILCKRSGYWIFHYNL